MQEPFRVMGVRDSGFIKQKVWCNSALIPIDIDGYESMQQFYVLVQSSFSIRCKGFGQNLLLGLLINRPRISLPVIKSLTEIRYCTRIMEKLIEQLQRKKTIVKNRRKLLTRKQKLAIIDALKKNAKLEYLLHSG